MKLKPQVMEFLGKLENPHLKDITKKYPDASERTLKGYLTEYRKRLKVPKYQNIPTYSELIKILYNDLGKEHERRVRKEIVSEIRQLLKEKGSSPDKEITILEELELWKQKKNS